MAKKARTPPPPRKVQAPEVRGSGTAGGERRRRSLLVALAAVVVLAAVGIALGLVFAGGGSSSPSAAGSTIDWAKLGPLHTGPPPWDNGVAYLPDRVAPLGLHRLAQEGVVRHDHQHVDLYVNGKHVSIPADIGIYDGQWITEIHTHDTRGVIHVESPAKKDFTLGQFFGEWGVKLTARCVANDCGHVQWWVNGKKMTGNPAALKLKAHQEIAIAAGKAPFVVPKSFTFPAGE